MTVTQKMVEGFLKFVTCLQIPFFLNNRSILQIVNTGWDLSNGSFQKPESQKNLEKSHAWLFKRLSRTCKFFNGDHWIAPKLKQLFTRSIIRIWCFLWLALLFDTQLRHILQIYTNKSFSSSFFMPTDEGMWVWSIC